MPERRSRAERLRSALLWWLGLALTVTIWHVAAFGQPAYVLPGPAAVVEALEGLAREEELGPALALTVQHEAVGLGLSCPAETCLVRLTLNSPNSPPDIFRSDNAAKIGRASCRERV